MKNLEILTEINQDIALLKRLNDTNDIDGRFRCAERIATNSYYLAELLSDAYEDMASLETEYDNAVSFDEDNFVGAVTKAKANAKNKNKDLNVQFSKAKALYKRLQAVLTQANVCIEQLRQSIAHLRDERRHSTL